MLFLLVSTLLLMNLVEAKLYDRDDVGVCCLS